MVRQHFAATRVAPSLHRTVGRLAIPLLLAAVFGCGGGESSPTAVSSGAAPTANFTSAPDGANPLIINFNDTSTPGSAPITSWNWSFGDGGTSTIQAPTHTYATAGSYTVSLTVTNSVGNNSRTGTVNPTPAPVAPSANFTARARSGPDSLARTGADSLVVDFIDTSTPGSQAISAWAWDFGDGTSATTQNPRHTFKRLTADQAFFDVSLRVTTLVGANTKTSTGYLEVYKRVIIDAPSVIVPNVSTVFNQQNSTTAALFTGSSAVLREFRPVVDSMVITMWEGSNANASCQAGNGPAEPTPSTFRGFLTYIPYRTGEDFRYMAQYGNPVVPIAADNWNEPLRAATLFRNRRTMLQYAGMFPTGGDARWKSCEQMTPVFGSNYTMYKISYNQPIAQLARIRRYTYYRPIPNAFFALGEQGGGIQYGASVSTGVQNTTSFEFTASITASVTAEAPGMETALSATLSTTYGMATTVTADTTVTVTRTAPANKANYNLQWTLWQEVQVFQIEGTTQGVLWSDPNYALVTPGQKLVFESPTGNVVESRVWIRK